MADATQEEELCTDAKMMIAVDSAGTICYSAKSGGCGLDPSMVFDMLDVSLHLEVQDLLASEVTKFVSL